MPDAVEEPGGPSALHGPAKRWMRPLGAATVVVVVVLCARADPRPALHGTGVGVTVALIALVAAALVALRGVERRFTVTLATVAIVLASAALVWLQHGGPAVAGIFLAVSYGALRLPLGESAGVAALGIAALAVAIDHAKHSAAGIASAELGLIAFYVISIFARRVQEAHDQTTRLLVQLRESREAQEEAAALRERGRIAREIHDVLAHSLSGLALQLEGARMLAAAPNANGELAAALDRAHHLARAGLEEARRAVGALRDEELPGPDRLQPLLADFSRDSGIDARLRVTGQPRQLDAESSLTLYRVAQEALTNARRHSRAESIDVEVSYDAGAVALVVTDHGLGTATGTAGGGGVGYGLTGMRERAALLGGTLHAAPTRDGFRVELRIPR